jgi:hypothetical protein
MDIRIVPDASIQATGDATGTRAPSVPPIPPPPAVANISPFGDLMGKLRELSEVSPEAFRQVTAQLRDVAHHAAAQAPGHQAAAIGELANGFDAASRTGRLSTLQAAGAAAHLPEGPVTAQLAEQVDAALHETGRTP